jgi:predicted nucleotidyltransferase
MAETETIIKAKEYLNRVRHFLAVERAFLFGSRAHATARADSDIDIGIFISSLDEEYFSLLKKLYALRREVDTRIEPHLYITNEDKTGFHDEVKKGIELV